MKQGGWRKTWVRSVGLFAPVLVLLGCFEHTITVGAGAPSGQVVHQEWDHHWLGGLIDPDQELELQEVCPSGNATIHGEMSFLNGLVGILTGGIYMPTTVTVRCDTGQNAEFDLDEEDVARIVSDPAFLDWVEAVAPDLLEAAEDAQQLLDG